MQIRLLQGEDLMTNPGLVSGIVVATLRSASASAWLPSKCNAFAHQCHDPMHSGGLRFYYLGRV